MAKTSLHLLSLFFILLFGCNNNNPENPASRTINSSDGVFPDTLDLIYDGPKGFTLIYFPREAIQLAHISACEIVDSDSSSEMTTRKILFDRNGNIIEDDNNYFQYWFNGTVRGRYKYYHDSSNNLLRMVGIPQEDSKDSIMTINNYNQKGQLYSRDRYEFAKKLKPGADRHLAGPNDFGKYPTWNKLETYKFSYTPNYILVETIYEGKTTEKEKCILQFDSLNRLQTITKYRDTSFVEVTHYSYDSNSITGNLSRRLNDGKGWTYISRALLDDKKNQTEKIHFKDDGTYDVKMVTTYNSDGTISRIKYNNSIQTFKYTYY